jgi:hypothetical protein
LPRCDHVNVAILPAFPERTFPDHFHHVVLSLLRQGELHDGQCMTTAVEFNWIDRRPPYLQRHGASLLCAGAFVTAILLASISTRLAVVPHA